MDDALTFQFSMLFLTVTIIDLEFFWLRDLRESA